MQDQLRSHRAVLFRNVKATLRIQMELTAAIGQPVGVRPRWHGRGVVPQVRFERDDPAPHNDVWHADGSWSRRPASTTVIHCLEAADTAAGTELADTAVGFDDLSEERKAELRHRSAFHHVEQAEALRFGSAADHGSPAPPASGGVSAAVAYRWRSWREQRRQGRTIRARRPVGPESPGACHPVVSTDGQREFVYLGAHAWRLDDEPGADSVKRIDRLMADVTDQRFLHRWCAGDLLVFDNRSLLHRREAGRVGARLLRRTLACDPAV